MPEQPDKRRSILLESVKLISPCCGRDDFSAKSTRFSWLFGKRFFCARCKATFRSPRKVRFKPVHYVDLDRVDWSEDERVHVHIR